MWIAGVWVPVSREMLYGIGFLLFLVAIAATVIAVKNRRKKDVFPPNRIFKGKNLERASKKTVKDLDLNYDDMPIVGLKWQKGDDALSESIYEEDEDDEDEDRVDDGYKDLTVVEKTIQEKAKQLQFTPQPKTAPKKDSKVAAKKESPKKKDATGDKMDFFTTGKSAL